MRLIKCGTQRGRVIRAFRNQDVDGIKSGEICQHLLTLLKTQQVTGENDLIHLGQPGSQDRVGPHRLEDQVYNAHGQVLRGGLIAYLAEIGSGRIF